VAEDGVDSTAYHLEIAYHFPGPGKNTPRAVAILTNSAAPAPRKKGRLVPSSRLQEDAMSPKPQNPTNSIQKYFE